MFPNHLRAAKAGIVFFFCIGITYLQAQNTTANLNYTDCGCQGQDEPQVELTIYNGLFGEWGGQEVPDEDEESKGAITVANLNDTDGDGIKDAEDDSVEENPKGRDEVDLMRLDISITGIVAPTCDYVYFNLSPGLRLWELSTKGTKIDGRVAVSDLPKSIYVEATRVSSSMKDMEIIAGLRNENEEMVRVDRVVATAMWAEIAETYTERSNLPRPNNSLGINEPGLRTVINDIFRSTDGSRYGQGTFGKTPYTLNTGSQVNVDTFLGGRILMSFKILPSGLIEELDDYGVEIDITRRKKIRTKQYDIGGVNLSRTVDWPIKVDAANDDGNTEEINDRFDEDTSPLSAGLVFSFDGPSDVRIRNIYSSFIKSNREFEEFVRVSFGADPVDNTLEGSRASYKLLWRATFDAAMKSSIHPTEPYNFDFSKLEVIESLGLGHTTPRCADFNTGNGTFTITPTAMQYGGPVDPYDLVYQKILVPDPANPANQIETSRWILYRVLQGDFDPIIASNNSVDGPWTITTPGISIEIINGTIPFLESRDYLFLIYDIEEETLEEIAIVSE